LRFYVDFHRMYEELEGCVINDVLPIAALIRPECLLYRPLLIRVDLEDGDHRGHTRIDPDGQRRAGRVRRAARTGARAAHRTGLAVARTIGVGS